MKRSLFVNILWHPYLSSRLHQPRVHSCLLMCSVKHVERSVQEWTTNVLTGIKTECTCMIVMVDLTSNGTDLVSTSMTCAFRPTETGALMPQVVMVYASTGIGVTMGPIRSGIMMTSTVCTMSHTHTSALTYMPGTTTILQRLFCGRAMIRRISSGSSPRNQAVSYTLVWVAALLLSSSLIFGIAD